MADADHITDVVWVNSLPNGTPARVAHHSGIMYLSKRVLWNMPPDYIYIVMLHEEGHIVLPTTDEEEADAYSFRRYAELGFDMDDTVKALKQLLNDKNPAQHRRITDQIKRYEKYKRDHNN